MDYSVDIGARVLRGEVTEAIHYASVAVVDASGGLTHYLGDPTQITMTRSSIKPFQLISLLTSGAADRFGFSARQLAIMCGSHSGDDVHRETILSCLGAIGLGSEALQCGAEWPIGMRNAGIHPTAGEDKDPTRSDCSGKHAGFLALAKHLGEDVRHYLEPENEAQQTVKRAVASFCEFPAGKMTTAVDGCSAPNFSMPLVNLALGFRKLACAQSDDLLVKNAVDRIRGAMWQHPEMVSGKGRFDLALSLSFPNNVVCKVGAEAIEGIGFADPPLGIAIKIHDGSVRALWTVAVEVLRQLGLCEDVTDYPHLAKYACPEVRNARDIVTGKIVADFRLKAAA